MYKDCIEHVINQKRFDIKGLKGLEGALGDKEQQLWQDIDGAVRKKDSNYIKTSIVRNAFLIELVNDKITSTKYAYRWDTRLLHDPRWASYDQCLEIANKLVFQIHALGKDDLLLLCRYNDCHAIPYELPFDYDSQHLNVIHRVDNYGLHFDQDAKDLLTLRDLIFGKLSLMEHEEEIRSFKKAYSKKIKIKTYLTDRALTGLYQTDREKRWETDPRSVQYALRKDCADIERKLILQIACFKGASKWLVEKLRAAGILTAEDSPWRCPITGETIEYDSFLEDAINSVHGKSKYQVGHLDPLKNTSDGHTGRHTADNVSWLSENGNRIQGSLSMQEVNALLMRIYINRLEEIKTSLGGQEELVKHHISTE